jgi:chemotaxis protein CheC
LTLDIIREVINIGVGDAADALSNLVDSRVLIKTPEVHILDSNEALNFIQKEIQTLGVYISQSFHGGIRGRTLLFYTKESCNALVKTILGKDTVTSALTETAISTLQEIGNILMVSCVSTITNLIDDSVSFEIPDVTIEISEGYLKNIIEDLGELDKTIVVRNQMVVKDKKIEGYIFLLLSFNDFLFVVDKMGKKIKRA